KSSKDLKDIIEGQRSEKVKEGVGCNAVPPPTADLYLSPKKDLSWTGLPEFVDDIVTDYSRPSPTVASTSSEDQNKDTSTSEETCWSQTTWPINPRRPTMNGARPYKTFFQTPSLETRPFLKSSAVNNSYRAPWVPTVNRAVPRTTLMTKDIGIVGALGT
nr:hypothetical protein [Tanacetum cinerariifolium]